MEDANEEKYIGSRSLREESDRLRERQAARQAGTKAGRHEAAAAASNWWCKRSTQAKAAAVSGWSSLYCHLSREMNSAFFSFLPFWVVFFFF